MQLLADQMMDCDALVLMNEVAAASLLRFPTSLLATRCPPSPLSQADMMHFGVGAARVRRAALIVAMVAEHARAGMASRPGVLEACGDAKPAAEAPTAPPPAASFEGR